MVGTNVIKPIRIALLLPTIELGAYWQPVVKHLTQQSEQTRLYTGRPWRGFDPQDLDNVAIEVVGETKRITASTEKTDYSGGFMSLSPEIVGRLFHFKPHVVIASGFSLWTMLALLFKPIGRWRVVLAWEGSSPSVDFRHSKARSLLRKSMANLSDAVITNSQAGKKYLVDFLGVKASHVTAQPYMVPDSNMLMKRLENADINGIKSYWPAPVFLYVGRIEQRKGLHLLLKACEALNRQSSSFTLLIVGDGPERETLEKFAQDAGLSDRIKWIGWVNYESLGIYFRHADVFIFPTLEDTWGMVALEAMAFGKPVLCSKWAGSADLVADGKNGYVFDPHQPEQLAHLMGQFTHRSMLADEMGQQATAQIAQHNPKSAAQFFSDTAFRVMRR